jgi:DNA (cytosine-5)-methyltransferase 1
MGGYHTIGLAEINPWCCDLLAQDWPGVPNFGDVRTADFSSVGDVRLLTAGYPCQPFSHAGDRRGERDDRHLWPTLFKLLPRFRSPWLCFENVAGHISMGLDQVLVDLESIGYTPRPVVIPACAVGAWHRRDRVWIIAYSEIFGERARFCTQHEGNLVGPEAGRRRPCDRAGEGITAHADSGKRGSRSRLQQQGQGSNCEAQAIADARGAGLSLTKQRSVTGPSKNRPGKSRPTTAERTRWHHQPLVGRMVHGIPRRVDRIRGLGNSIYPEIAARIFEAIAQEEKVR